MNRFFELTNGQFILANQPYYTSADGTQRAPLSVITHQSWTPAQRQAFGIYTVDITPPAGHQWLGEITNNAGTPEPVYEPIIITAADVVVERERRLTLGFDYDFADARGTHRIATTEHDMKGWEAVTKWAQAKHALGQDAATKTIVTETGPVDITPIEWYQIIDAGDAFQGPIWAASFALQAMDPIPTDYTDNSYWSIP